MGVGGDIGGTRKEPERIRAVNVEQERIRPRLTTRLMSIFSDKPAELVERMRRNEPYRFPPVKRVDDEFRLNGEQVEVEHVGGPRDTVYPTFHDMRIPAIQKDMTDAVFLEDDFNPNAFYTKDIERLDDYTGRSTYQPVKVRNPAISVGEAAAD